jgi:hypothetical protein
MTNDKLKLNIRRDSAFSDVKQNYFITIYKDQKELKPMTSHYTLELIPKSPVDVFIQNALNVSIYNNKSKNVLTKTMFIALFVIVLMLSLHCLQLIVSI